MPPPPKVRLPRKVWRISKNAPWGEWVDPNLPVAAPASAPQPEVSEDTWVTSSFDLANGVDVNEEPDTVPGDLLDELFAPKAKERKGPKS